MPTSTRTDSVHSKSAAPKPEASKPLAGKTLFVTGASRGIGLAISIACAREGANVVIAAKTTEVNPKLPGTIYTAAEECEKAGRAHGTKALAVCVDIRDEEQVKQGVRAAVERFGGIDILVNNASAIWVQPTLDTPMKKYDLMHQINARGTFLVSQTCLPYLLESAKKRRNPHILNLSPPLDMSAKWLAPCVAYTAAKYDMSMFAMGMAEEYRGVVCANTLWPRTAIATAAIDFIAGPSARDGCRTVDIMAEAALWILTHDETAEHFIDEDLLREKLGVTDFARYACVPGKPLMLDFFVEPSVHDGDTFSLVPVAKL